MEFNLAHTAAFAPPSDLMTVDLAEIDRRQAAKLSSEKQKRRVRARRFDFYGGLLCFSERVQYRKRAARRETCGR